MLVLWRVDGYYTKMSEKNPSSPNSTETYQTFIQIIGADDQVNHMSEDTLELSELRDKFDDAEDKLLIAVRHYVTFHSKRQLMAIDSANITAQANFELYIGALCSKSSQASVNSGRYITQLRPLTAGVFAISTNTSVCQS